MESLADVDAEFEEFTVNARRTPHRVFAAHGADHLLNVFWNARTLTARVGAGVRVQPGNLYIADPDKAAGCPHVLCRIDKFELGYGMLHVKDDANAAKLAQEIAGWKKLELSPNDVKDRQKALITQRDHLFRQVLDKCLAAVLEITPACAWTDSDLQINPERQ
jgi:hypothetical protein